MNASLSQIVTIITSAKENAFKKVNEELIHMYWKVGEFLSKEAEKASFGDAYMDSVANYIQKSFPVLKDLPGEGCIA